MIRLFIAVPIPDNIRMILHGMGRSLQGARAVPEEQIHITLRFIGEVEGSLYHDIKHNLSTVEDSSFSMNIQGVGHFPPRGKPRVIWAGLQPTEYLSSLKRKIDTALITCGVPPDKRKFSPHITIARLNKCSIDRVTQFLAGNSFLQFDNIQVNCFNLFSSKISQKGARHTLEASYPLQSS